MTLPSGTVTFLFTDIEGSTALVRQLRDRYQGVLGDHQTILRAAVARPAEAVPYGSQTTRHARSTASTPVRSRL
jgi:class 3 adenylate cyclase